MSHELNSGARLTRRQLLAAGAALATAGLLDTASGHASTAAEAYVTRVGEGVLKAANSGSVGSFRALLRQNADIPAIALFSLGPYRKDLPASRRQEYYGLVEQYISSVFAAHSPKLRGQALKVSGSREASDSVIVTSSFKSADGRTVPVTWRLVKKSGGYKVFDVNVEGIWLATTQKTNFVSVLKKNNGNFEALIAYLRK